MRVEEKDSDSYGQCGTVACIAGHAVNGEFEEPVEHRYISQEARRLLGINELDAHYLFFGSWAAKEPTDISVEETLAYLDKCIEAGEIVRLTEEK